MTFELDSGLREFATDRQWELLEAWQEHGTIRKAAEALGISNSLFVRALATVRRKASLRGYHTEPTHFDADIPVGLRIGRQSVNTDPSGNLKQRWDIAVPEGLDEDEERRLPDPKTTKRLATMRGPEGRAIIQWQTEEPTAEAKLHAWRAFADEMAQRAHRVEPVEGPTLQDEDLLVTYPVADHHLGMLAWDKECGVDYDLRIGERLLTSAMSYLTRAGQPAKRAVVPFMGDYLHYSGHLAETPTSHNRLDTDSRYPKMARVSVKVARAVIGMALLRHEHVDVFVLPGNHDLDPTPFFALILSVAYENEPRVTVHVDPRHYQYIEFGRTLLGFHHGHGLKMEELPMLMAGDCKEAWGRTDFRYWLTGHIHHKEVRAKDHIGCSVESLRILPPGDAWHNQRGYRPMREMVAITYHRLGGEMHRTAWRPNVCLFD